MIPKIPKTRYSSLPVRIAQAKSINTSPAPQKQPAKGVAALQTTVAAFGERDFNKLVVNDRKDWPIPQRYFDRTVVPAMADEIRKAALLLLANRESVA